MSVNMFKPRKFEDHEIADGNGNKGGDIRVKPSGIVRYRGGIMNIHRMVLIAATAFLITSGTLDAQNVFAAETLAYFDEDVASIVSVPDGNNAWRIICVSKRSYRFKLHNIYGQTNNWSRTTYKIPISEGYGSISQTDAGVWMYTCHGRSYPDSSLQLFVGKGEELKGVIPLEVQGCNLLHPTIVMDGNDPLVCFRDDSNQRLLAAKVFGSDWQIEVVDKNNDTGWCPSAVRLPENKVGVVYSAKTMDGGEIRFAERDYGYWRLERVVSPVSLIEMSISISVSPAGTVGIAYVNDGISFSRRISPRTWRSYNITDGYSVSSPSLTFIPGNRPVIAYRDSSRNPTGAFNNWLNLAVQTDSKDATQEPSCIIIPHITNNSDDELICGPPSLSSNARGDILLAYAVRNSTTKGSKIMAIFIDNATVNKFGASPPQAQ